MRFLNARSLWLLRHRAPDQFGQIAERMLAQQWELVHGAVGACGLSAAAVQDHEELGRRFLLGSGSTASSSACERFAGARQGLQLWTAKAATEGGAAAHGAAMDRAMGGCFFVLASLDAAVGHAEALQQREDTGGGGGGGGGGGVLSEDVPLLPLLRYCTEDVGAFSVEKHGAAPNFQLDQETAGRGGGGGGGGGGGEGGLRLRYCVEGFVVYSLMEVLKNSCVAMVKAFGALDVDDEDETPPVRVRAAPNFHGNGVVVSIRDYGSGLPLSPPRAEEVAFDPFAFYATRDIKDLGGQAAAAAAGEEREQQFYGYSRDHGAPMSGMGVGLSRARVYAAFHGGALDLRNASDGERGAVATLQLPLLARTVPRAG